MSRQYSPFATATIEPSRSMEKIYAIVRPAFTLSVMDGFG